VAGNRTPESERSSGLTLTDAAVRGLTLDGGLRDQESANTNGKSRASSTPDPRSERSSTLDDATEQIGLLTLPGGLSGYLNPRWVAQLMGFPASWLDLPSSALLLFEDTETP
jgi:hypothetical protein